MVRRSLLFLAVAATGCSFQAHSAQQAQTVDSATGGEPSMIVHDAAIDARVIDAPPDAKVF
ncbi:MAG: hypothetical protein JO257_09085, partial [Deltaproteobacteria bacterium]|nr:hypothetical protein [Deltaproteobacteria bacterium]